MSGAWQALALPASPYPMSYGIEPGGGRQDVRTWLRRVIKKAKSRRVGAPLLDVPTQPSSVPSRIDIGDRDDVLYWSRVLRVAPEEVLAAVERVGSTDVSAVAKYLLGGTVFGK